MENHTDHYNGQHSSGSRPTRTWILDFLLVVILILGAWLRLTGVNWDQNKHLHPDERFLTFVEVDTSPVKSLAEYFDTDHSSLNPQNRGHTFFVYGTLPIFLVRYVAEWVGKTGYDQVNLVGRQLSAIADLLTVLLVYLVAARLYDRRVGVLAAAFSAFAVLQIQLSHYFTVDTFTNLFTFLAIYFAVRVMDHVDFPALNRKPNVENRVEEPVSPGALGFTASMSRPSWLSEALPGLSLFILFGVALGMAVASKINAAPLAVLLPVALAIRLSRLSQEEIKRQLIPAAAFLAVAAVVSLLVFRIFQPYAFTGPGFFGMRINPKWLSNLRELSGQSSGSVDAPFALQWTRRPIWFSLYNMVAWGLGWPLGVLAWAGFLWMGWRILKGEWRSHALIWAWTGIYFVWQSISLTRAMRYQILIYPTLAIIAAWAVIRLWDEGRDGQRVEQALRWIRGKWIKIAAVALGSLVVIATFAWAFAFSRIYTRPLTRVSASYWFYQNMPGPVELQVQTPTGPFNQQLNYPNGFLVTAGQPLVLAFRPDVSGSLIDINLEHVVASQQVSDLQSLSLTVAASQDFAQPLSVTTLSDSYVLQNPQSDDPKGKAALVTLDQAAPVEAGRTYYLKVEVLDDQTAILLNGTPTLTLVTKQGPYYQPLNFLKNPIRPGEGYTVQFNAQVDGTLQKLRLPHVLDQSGTPGEKTLQVIVSAFPDGENTAAAAQVQSGFSAGAAATELRGKEFILTLDKPVQLVKGHTYQVSISLASGDGMVVLTGTQHAKETDWDDDVPQPLDNYPWPVDLYQLGELNLQVYWPDDPKAYSDPRENKLTRYETILEQADVIVITSNRQWGTTTRVPERYPLTTAYYRDLIGCPPGKDILWCYSVAKPGMFQGKLGFDLETVFQSNPNLGSLEINDQLAEEAFTVYDHPKVLVFKKRPDYTQQQVVSRLSSVDTSHVIHILPNGEVVGGVTSEAKSLLLPADQAESQQTGGTWSALFNRDFLQNSYPFLGLVLWYITVAGLGLLVYPIVRLAFPGLPDRGYPFARLSGLLILAYLVWLAGSAKVPFTRVTIGAALLTIALAGAVLAFVQREDLLREWRQRRGYFWMIEAVALVFFTLDLLIRLGNPDLWHPAFGGEKPMDFSFFNAILKSTSFPPYDPWYAGGYINYYYYGFVIVGVLVKFLGIIPSVAYNLILPTLFMFLALGAFSLGWNLLAGRRLSGKTGTANLDDLPPGDPPDSIPVDTNGGLRGRAGRWGRGIEALFRERAFQAGIAAALAFLILGNLGTVRMIWYGFQKLAAPNGNAEDVSVIQHWAWAFQGLPKYLAGAPLPYYPGDWYWKPSRVIPEVANEITEFPFFTILYADLHAHLMALPITLLVLAWGLSIVLSRGRWGEMDGRHRWLSLVASFGLGALAIGALRPSNTWDFYTYLVFGCAALVYGLWRGYQANPRDAGRYGIPGWVWRAAAIAGGVLVLAGLSTLMYEPFSHWYAQAYNKIDLWNGHRTPFWSYLTHWGLFLFVIISWLTWETRQWMASTPLSSLARLRPYQGIIGAGLIGGVGIIAAMLAQGIQIAWLVLPLAAWAAILIFRPDQPDVKRFVLFMTGTGLFVTLAVEIVVLHGDIGRMNTVFKFYLQAWTMLAIASAAGFGWLLKDIPSWLPSWEFPWKIALTLLVFGAALFPVLAGQAKIKDRMVPEAPHTLDGMTYMDYARYTTGPDNGEAREMDLSQDYRGIRWMQDHVKGSPVIIEANTPLYHWGTRYTIYTGLPGVIGWDWHERQQRAVQPDTLVYDRVTDVGTFFTTTDSEQAVQILQKYNVQYIVVGQQERIFYPGPGLDKFPEQNGKLWNEVYRDGDTVIYAVIPGIKPAG